MRRWLKYGVDRGPGNVPLIIYPKDVNRGGAGDPYWITMPHHEVLRTTLNQIAGGGGPITYYLACTAGNPTDPPAPDCTAQHIFNGFYPIFGAAQVPFALYAAIFAGFPYFGGVTGRLLADDSSYGPLDDDYDGR